MSFQVNKKGYSDIIDYDIEFLKENFPKELQSHPNFDHIIDVLKASIELLFDGKDSYIFHNSRIAFYIDENGIVITIPKGMTHKDYFESINHIEYIETLVRGYYKKGVIMLYQGDDFRVPEKNFDINNIIEKLGYSKEDIIYVGLGCVVDGVGKEWKPIKKLNLNRGLV